MRKSIIFTLGLMLGVFGMTGCSKDATNEHINGDVDVKEFTLISHAAAPDTRMVIEGDKTNGFNTVWEEGDQIGIYATDYVAGEEATNNLLYTCNYYQTATVGSDGKATFTGKIRSTDSNEFNLFAYYPYTSGSTYADTDYQTGVNCAIAATQTMNDKSFDKSCAYMVAKTGLTVKISADSTAYDIGNWQFRHVNAFINLGTKAITADGVSGEEIVKSATIEAVGSSETNPTLAGSFQFNLENGEMTFTDETPQNAVTVNVPDGTTLADLSAWFVTNPFTLTADDKLEIVINTKTHVIKKNVTIAKSFEAANAYTLNLTIDNNCEVSDAPEEDYSGTYLILAKVTAGNYWYLMPKETSKRLDAEDTGISNITNYESSAKDFPTTGNGYAWVIEKNAEGDTYTIKSLSTNMYIYGANASNNYAQLSDTSKEVVSIVKTDDENGCTYNIQATSVTDTNKYLSRNATATNNYFAFYKTGQIKDLLLIPYVATPHIVPNTTSVDVEAAGGDFADITYKLENFETTPTVTVTCDGSVVTEAIDVDGTIMYTVSENTTSSVHNGWIQLSAEGAKDAKITVTQKEGIVKLVAPSATMSSFDASKLVVTWTAVDNASSYSYRLTQNDASVDVTYTLTTDGNTVTLTLSGTFTADTEYVLYVKSVGDGTNYLDSDEASLNVSFSEGGGQEYSVAYTFTASGIGSGYSAHTGVCANNGITWTVTFGQQTYIGTNSTKKDNCKLGDDYAKVGTPMGYTSTTTQVAAIISESTMSNISKIVVSGDTDSKNPENISLVYSTDGNTYTLIETQTYSNTNGNTWEFSPIESAYYAIVLQYGGTSYMRTNNLKIEYSALQ
ncbi:MAG: fimbrillin family protein [Alistipes sp.]